MTQKHSLKSLKNCKIRGNVMKKSKIENKEIKTQPNEYTLKFNSFPSGRYELHSIPTPEEEKRNKKIGQLLTRKFLILKNKEKLCNLASGFVLGCLALAISTFVFIGSMFYKAYDFSKTDDFKSAKDTKISQINKDYESGKITDEQYKGAQEYVHGVNFMIDTMLQSDSKQKRDYNALNIAGTVSSSATIAAGLAALGCGIASKRCDKKAEKIDKEMGNV